MNIIKITDASMDYYDYKEEQGFGEFRYVDRFDLNDLFNVVVELERELGRVIKPWDLLAEKVTTDFKDVLDEYHEAVESEDTFESLSDWLEYQYSGGWESEADVLALVTDFELGTVGYSPWSYVVHRKGANLSMIADIYNGYNMYDVTYEDMEGEVIDCAWDIHTDGWKVSDLIAGLNYTEDDKILIQCGYLENDSGLEEAEVITTVTYR